MGHFAIIHAATSYTTPDGQQAHGRSRCSTFAFGNYPWPLAMGFPLPAPFPTKRTEETIHMKAIVVTDQAAGTAGMALVERPEPHAAINDVVVQVHASGFVPTELAWPSTWTDRREIGREHV